MQQERAECSAELSPRSLSAIRIAPRTLDFGRVSTASPAAASLVVTNDLASAVHVALDLSRVPELAGSSQLAQVVPVGGSGKFTLALRAHELRVIREACELCINGAHFAPLEVGGRLSLNLLYLLT